MRGLIIAAPSSGSGKTTLTLGILRALRDQKVPIRAAKSGPDYIDPKFHQAACGRTCINLDAWAMSPDRIRALAAGPELLIIEGAMGLFDGALPDGKGSVAELARILALPVVLVVDASKIAQSVAPLVAGFAAHDPDVRIAGVILNKVGSPRHEKMLRAALAAIGMPVLGAVSRDEGLALPSRHLGLVQAEEHTDLQDFLDGVAAQICEEVDLTALTGLAAPLPKTPPRPPIAPIRRHIAMAQDVAFAFSYPHLFQEWVRAGATLTTFSPLDNDPVPPADIVFLPGGYPELHAKQLSEAQTFLCSLRNAAQTSDIYGECGGYMVLGESIQDASGTTYPMAGLLALQTSFAERKLHLGYRRLKAEQGPMKGAFNGHEFHYATTLKAEGTPLFTAQSAEGEALPPMGLRKGRVAGSFAHIIERVLP